MPHCDEETLSLLALGESAPPEVEAHVAGCPHCSGQLAGLRRVVTVARPAVRMAPPPLVWQQIAAATGVHATPRPDEVLRHARLPLDIDDWSYPVDETTPAAPAGNMPALPRQRSKAFRLDRRLLSVAAGCLVAGLLGGVLGTRLLSDDDSPATQAPVVAATRLDGLPAAPAATGQADVVQSGQGRRTLDLDVRRLDVAEGFYEVWLIDPTVTKMVPVGVLSGAEGHFTLPAGVDLADYPVVDVSVEPLDGDPAHSGRSVLRGTLRS